MDWSPVFITFKLALITTLALFLLGVPLAYWLSYGKFRMKPAIEALVTMPLVLPPSVLGFYLLIAFGPKHFLGSFLSEYLNINLLFTFEGLIVASMIYSLPFMVQPIQSALEHLPRSLEESSKLLGKSNFTTLIKVLLPNIKASVLTSLVLTFTHTVGEFGVVLMIGGSIPGETKLASIAIYEEVEAMNYGAAHTYSFILFAISFTILLLIYSLNKKAIKVI